MRDRCTRSWRPERRELGDDDSLCFFLKYFLLALSGDDLDFMTLKGRVDLVPVDRQLCGVQCLFPREDDVSLHASSLWSMSASSSVSTNLSLPHQCWGKRRRSEQRTAILAILVHARQCERAKESIRLNRQCSAWLPRPQVPQPQKRM